MRTVNLRNGSSGYSKDTVAEMLEKTLSRVMEGARTPEGRIIAILLVVCLSLMTWNVGALSFAVNGEAAKAAEQKAIEVAEEKKDRALESAQDNPAAEPAKQTKAEAEQEQQEAEAREREAKEKKEAEKKRKAREKEAQSESNQAATSAPAQSEGEAAEPAAAPEEPAGQSVPASASDENQPREAEGGQPENASSDEEPEPQQGDEPQSPAEQPSQVVTTADDERPDGEDEMPACKFSARANGVAVKVSAPRGAFPKGTTMAAAPVAAAQVIDAVEDAIDGNAVTIRAIDVSFVDPDGTVIDPAANVSVTLKAADIAAAMGNDERSVALVEVGDGDAVSVGYEAKAKSPNAITFAGNASTIYAIAIIEQPEPEDAADGGEGPDETESHHLTYKFFLTDERGDTSEYRVDGKLATQTVKEGDALVEPKEPSVGEHAQFSGWYVKDTRELLEFGVVGSIERDATIEVVGDINKVFHARLMDGRSSDSDEWPTLANLSAQAEKGQDTAVVNLGGIEATSPSDDDRFLGWSLHEGADAVEFEAGSDIRLSEDVVLYPVFEHASLLSFDGNDGADGSASYTAPERVPQNVAPSRPADPKREGYDFAGWFTQPEGGEEYAFDENARIDGPTTLYAHWNRAEATYTVIFWQQSSLDDKAAPDDEKTYDYVESTTRKAPAGDEAALTDADASMGYTGFHFNEAASDMRAAVEGDGSTVLNVRYDRDAMTLTFGDGGEKKETLSGLFGQPLDRYGYSWPNGSWKCGDVDVEFLGSFLPPNGVDYSSSLNFTSAGEPSGTANFYLQDLDGRYPETPSGQGSLPAEGTYVLSNCYDGFDVEGYQNENESSSGRSGDWEQAKAGDSVAYASPLGVRFERKAYSVDFQNGSDGSLGAVRSLFGSPLSDIAPPDKPSYPGLADEAPLYEFVGWFADPECTVHVSFGKGLSDKQQASLRETWGVQSFAVFETMPARDVTVYAGWMKKSANVTIDANGGTLPQGARDSFQVRYGDTIDSGLLMQATRPGYTLASWNVDAADGQPWDFGKGVSGDVRLVASWVGESDVFVIYDAGIGANAPVDPDAHGEGDTVTVGHEPEPPSGQAFVGWRLQKADGSAGGTYSPGQTFKIAPEYLIGRKGGNRVRLVAEYVTHDATTMIAYSANGGDGSIDSQALPVDAVTRLSDGAPLTRDGYTLVGWSLEPGEDNQVAFKLGGLIAADKVGEEENTLYAVWAENVSIVASGVEGTTYEYDGARKLNDDPVMIYEVGGEQVDELPQGVSYTLAGKAAGVCAGDYNDELVITLGDYDANRYYVTTEVHNGSLRITRAAVTVTVEGTRAVVPYDGTEHVANGFEAMSDNEAFDPNTELVFTGEARAARTDAGTTSMGLSADQFALAESSNFELAKVNIIDGYQKVEPLHVGVKVMGAIKTVGFTGQDYVAEGFSLVSDNPLYNAEENVSIDGAARARSSQPGTTPMGLSADQFSNVNGNFDVTFDVTDGRLVVAPAGGVVVVVKGNSAQGVYTGEEQAASGYTIQSSDPAYTEESFSFTGTAEATRTDVGTTPMGLSADQFQNTDDRFADVVFDVVDGYVEVMRAQAVVTVKGARPDPFIYDRQAHEAAGYTVESSNPAFVVERDLIAQTSAEEARVSRVDAGTYAMGLSAGQFSNGNSANVNVTFVVEDGRLVIAPVTERVTVKITGRKGHVSYDRVEHSVSGYEAASSNELYHVGGDSGAADFSYGGKASVKETNAGTYAMGLVRNEFANLNDNFTDVVFEVEDGELVIDKVQVDVKVTGRYAERVYNGTEQHVEGYDVEFSNDLYTTADFRFNGSPIARGVDAGSYFMDLSRDKFVNLNANFDVSFAIEDGFLVIAPVAEEVRVAIVGSTAVRTYNGSGQSAEGYDVAEISNPLYSESYFSFKGAAAVEARDAGEHPMGLAAEQFSNISKNFSNVVFDVKDGSLTIKPLDVKVRITGAHDSVGGDGEEHVVSGYTFEADTPLYTEGDFSFAGDATAARTEAGTTQMGLSADQFSNENPNFGAVSFEVVDGYQTIAAPGEVVVTITGHSDLVAFDARAHSIEGYDVETSDPSYTEQDFEFVGNAQAEATYAGVTAMGLDPSQFRNVDDSYQNVTFNVVDGTLEITPVAVVVSIEGSADTRGFDAVEHEVAGFTAVADVNDGLADDAVPVYDTDLNVQLEGDARAARQHVGVTYMGLEASRFSSADTTNFSSVTFLVKDGYQAITPVAVKVTVTGNAQAALFDGTEHVAEGYEAVADVNAGLPQSAVPVFDLANVRFEGSARAARTDAGTSYMGLSAEQFSSTDDDNFSSVEFEVVDGYVQVDPIDVSVTVIGDANTADYDGSDHSVSGYEATTSSPLYSTDDFEFTGSADARRTDAGTTYMNLSPAQFANKNANFRAVTFEVADGYQTVRPIDATVTVTGASDVVSYDGSLHTVSGYTAVADVNWPAGDGSGSSARMVYDTVNDIDFVGEGMVERSTPGTTRMGLEPSQFSNKNANFRDVTFKVIDGSITVAQPGRVAVSITGNSVRSVYDTQEHAATGYTMKSSDPLFTEDMVSFSGTAEAKATDVGTVAMGLSADQFASANPEEFPNVDFVVEDGFVEVTKAQAIVTITGHKGAPVRYDRNWHEVSGYTVSASNGVFRADRDLEAKVSPDEARAGGVDAKSYAMGLTSSYFSNKNAANVDVMFVIKDGGFSILPVTEPVVVTVKGNDQVQAYDGAEHSASGYAATASNPLYHAQATSPDAGQAEFAGPADFSYDGPIAAKGKDAGTYAMGLEPKDFENQNANFENVVFEVEDGSLTVIPAHVNVSIEGMRTRVAYTGDEQEASGYRMAADNALYSEKDFTFIGTGIARGTDVRPAPYVMGLDADQFVNTNENFDASFAVTDGQLVIDPIDVKVNIVGHRAGVCDDGAEHVVEGYDLRASTPLFTKDDLAFAGAARASLAGEGTAAMGLSADQFRCTSGNFGAVEIEVEDGYLAVAPADGVVVNITGHVNSTVYDGAEHAVSGFEFESSDGSYTVSDVAYEGDARAARVDAGTTQMGLTADQFSNANERFGNVVFVVTDGYQEIAPAPVNVTVVGERDTAGYDGEEHGVSGFDVRADNALYRTAGDEVDFAYQPANDGAEAASAPQAARTDVGTTKMGLDASCFSNVNGNFGPVTFAVEDGFQTVTPATAKVSVVGHVSRNRYDGSPHEATGYDVYADVPFYTESDIGFSGQAAAVRIVAGTTGMGLSAGQFVNRNPNFETVTFVVSDGCQVVEKLDAVVKITGGHETVPYDGKRHIVSGYVAETDVNAGEGQERALLDVVNDVTLAGASRASRTEEGTTYMELSPDLFSCKNPNFGTVTFEVSDGYIEIAPPAA